MSAFIVEYEKGLNMKYYKVQKEGCEFYITVEDEEFLDYPAHEKIVITFIKDEFKNEEVSGVIYERHGEIILEESWFSSKEIEKYWFEHWEEFSDEVAELYEQIDVRIQ